jgi:hypothetical protein
VRFQVLAVAIMEMTAFRDIAPCNIVEVDRRFRGMYCLRNQAQMKICIWFLMGKYLLYADHKLRLITVKVFTLIIADAFRFTLLWTDFIEDKFLSFCLTVSPASTSVKQNLISKITFYSNG